MLNKEQILAICFPMMALICTFLVANSTFSFSIKIILFAGIILFYFFLQIGFSFSGIKKSKKGIEKSPIKNKKEIFTGEIEEKLLILEEANNFFGASLKSADMFRLVASRINQMVEFETCVLFLISEQNKMEVKFATGLNSRLFGSLSLNCDEGLAGKAFVGRKIEADPDLSTEKTLLFKECLKDLQSAIAIPLYFGGEVFAVLNLYSSKKANFNKDLKILLEAIGERVAPLIKSSFTFEKSLTNALVDSLTNLPNERAFFLVLENQIAEAQRFQSQRDLSILAVDIKHFSEINSKFGHTTGDEILFFTSQLIKTQLREMDFLARSQNDEFLIILPTANGELSQNIIKRISRVFANKPFEITKGQKQIIELNFGSATFYQDGETSNHLFRAVISNKQQGKAINNNSVIKFPREYIN